MEPLLFDTTVWIDFLNGTINSETDKLAYYIQHRHPVMTCPTIVQEVLQGIGDDRQFQRVRTSLLSFRCLSWSSIEAAIAAAQLYRDLRKRGVTIRKSNDCLIAAFALHFDLRLAHRDQDFSLIAAHSTLKVFSL